MRKCIKELLSNDNPYPICAQSRECLSKSVLLDIAPSRRTAHSPLSPNAPTTSNILDRGNLNGSQRLCDPRAKTWRRLKRKPTNRTSWSMLSKRRILFFRSPDAVLNLRVWAPLGIGNMRVHFFEHALQATQRGPAQPRVVWVLRPQPQSILVVVKVELRVGC